MKSDRLRKINIEGTKILLRISVLNPWILCCWRNRFFVSQKQTFLETEEGTGVTTFLANCWRKGKSFLPPISIIIEAKYFCFAIQILNSHWGLVWDMRRQGGTFYFQGLLSEYVKVAVEAATQQEDLNHTAHHSATNNQPSWSILAFIGIKKRIFPFPLLLAKRTDFFIFYKEKKITIEHLALTQFCQEAQK